MSDEQNANVPVGDEAVQETAGVESQPTEQPAESSVEDVSIETDAAQIAEKLKGREKQAEPKQETEEEVPLHLQERWQQVTGKLTEAEKRAQENEQRARQNEQAATYWTAFNQYAAEKPEAAIGYLEYLESKGMVEGGTVERAKKEMGLAKEGDSQAQLQSGEQPVDYKNQVKEVLQSDPTYQYVDQQRQQKEMEAEKVFQDFEASHPDVPEAASADPSIRRRIFFEAQDFVRKGKPMNEALEDAYRWVMHRDEVLKEAQETGEVEGLTSGIQQGIVTGTSSTGTARTNKSVKLTAQQREFAKMFNMSDEEYVRYMNDPQGALSEDMNSK